MTLEALADALRAQAAAKSQLVLDASVFPDAVLAGIRTAFLLPQDANLTITGVRPADIPAPTHGVLTLAAGQAAVLNRTEIAMTLTFTAPGGALAGVITAPMGAGWKFTDSFSSLDQFPFSALEVSGAHFVYATVEQPAFAWPGEPDAPIELAAGMNFLSRGTLSAFSALGGLLGDLIGVRPVRLYGAFGPQAGEALPVGTLTAKLSDGTFRVGAEPFALKLGHPAVAVQIGPSNELNPVQDVALLVQGVFNDALNIAIRIPPGGDVLTVRSSPLPNRGSINQLIESLPGGRGFTAYVPAPVADLFARVRLDEFSMVVGAGAKVTTVHLSIGTEQPWTLIDDVLTLEELQLQVETFDPTGLALKQVSIEARATFLPDIFPDPFEFTVELEQATAWQISAITGAYDGAANLGQIVAGMLGKPNVVPAALRAISFAEFGVELRRSSASYNYTLFGRVDAAFPVLGRELAAGLQLRIDRTEAKVQAALSGTLVIGGQTFSLALDLGQEGSKLSAAWNSQGEPLGFGDIARALGWEMPALPENLDLGLKSAAFFYDFSGGTLAFRAESVNYGEVLFVAFDAPASGPHAGERRHVFALTVPLDVDFSALPVIGEKLPASVKYRVKDLQVLVASAELTAADVKTVNETLTEMLQGGSLVPKTLGAGVTFAAQLVMGNSTQPVVVPLTGGKPAPRALASTAEGSTLEVLAPAGTGDYRAGAKWFTVQKSFGPVHFERIGLQYEDGALFFLLDASLSFSSLSFAVQGLGIGSPLKKFAPQPTLDGLAVSFRSGPVSVEGGLLVVPKSQLPPDVEYQYLGAVTIAVEPYLISGVAAYAKVAGSPSFFLFAQVKGSFGGPPAFFITGFMGGFGYNSRLALPAPEKVYQFPFLAGLDNPEVFGPNPTPMSALTVLSRPDGERPAVVTPATGESWLAAGVLFRSFELVLGRALVVAQFGREFQVTVLGLASASLPQGATTNAYAYLELQLQAVFKPDEGFFGVIASLTPSSFLITRDCKLTGGFAFCTWFGSNPHAGDFVVTVGGYHPAFAVPAWYPRVAPVSFSWKPSSNVTIKGGAYFALTPSAIMAGGGLEVLFESGAIRAWFTAYANLLVSWKPFHFVADIGISLGAAVRVDLLFTTVTLSFELGATLELWGPPTGGIVHVHLYIVSFSIPFGSSEGGATPGPLGWSDFKTLLPQEAKLPVPRGLLEAAGANPAGPEPTVLGVHINRGLARQDPAGRWIVRADELIFTTDTAVPATELSFTGSSKAPALAAGAKPVPPPAKINIRPMALTGVTSSHAIKLTNVDDRKTIDLAGWTQVPQARNLPEAMWGATLPAKAGVAGAPSASSATVPNLPVGTRLIAPPAVAGATPGPMNLDRLTQRLGTGWQPLTPATQADAIPAPVVNPRIIATIATTLDSEPTRTAQRDLVAALQQFHAEPPPSVPLARLAKQAGETFAEPPLSAV